MEVIGRRIRWQGGRGQQPHVCDGHRRHDFDFDWIAFVLALRVIPVHRSALPPLRWPCRTGQASWQAATA